jgi:predicted nucleic acid-binding protein
LVEGAAAFGGGSFVADTSAWQRSRRGEVADAWSEAVQDRRIATCPIVVMELLYSARDATMFEELERRLAHFRDVPVTRSVTNSAISALRALARIRPLHHRLPFSDVLIAAVAQDAGLGVLHYDEHFDRLAEVMSFESRWIAPRGSLD